MSFPKTLKAAKAESFGVVAEGDATTQAGFLLTEENLNNIEAAQAAAETTNANLTKQVGDLTKERDDANTAAKTSADQVAALNTQITTLTTERDNALALAKEFGAKSEEPAATDKGEDKFNPGKKTTPKSSMDKYFEEMNGFARQ